MRKRQHLLLFVLFLTFLSVAVAVFSLPAVARGKGEPADLVISGPGQRYTESVSVFDVRDLGYRPVTLPPVPGVTGAAVIKQGGGSDPENPYAVIQKTGPVFTQPGAMARYEIRLANYESVTRTYRLTDTLPAQLAYVPGSATGLVYDPAAHALSWQGQLPPGQLDTIIEENTVTLPYLDLADFGAVNLCDDFIAAGEACRDVAVTFNLGVSGYSANLYGEALSRLTVSSNGLVLAQDEAVVAGANQWLPDAAAPNFLLAGLWRDVDFTAGGRWHAAVITGLIADHDLFYAQWHNAPHAADADLSARHAVAIVLNSRHQAKNQPMTGHAFFIYDNVSDPAGTAARGYTIGSEDVSGTRGLTYAYAPCCGQTQPTQGFPPAPGTTLHLRPVLFGDANAFARTFTYRAVVRGQIPQTIINTAIARIDGDDQTPAAVWASHYLYVRRQTYLPLVWGEGRAP
jgi:hypothetical protein